MLELTQKYKHHLIYFKKRKCFYFYIPIGLTNFLSNTELKEKISIVEIDKVLEGLLPENELKTFNECLNRAFDIEKSTHEPYLSICKQTLKRVFEHCISINSTGLKTLFITNNYKLYDLINFSKNKFAMIPINGIIDKDISEIKQEDQVELLKTIINVREKEINAKVFKSIKELDIAISELMKLKRKN